MLLPFFGQGAIRGREEMDRVADILRDIAPEAAVVLAIENLLSARDNAIEVDRIALINVGGNACFIFARQRSPETAQTNAKPYNESLLRRRSSLSLSTPGYLNED